MLWRPELPQWGCDHCWRQPRSSRSCEEPQGSVFNNNNKNKKLNQCDNKEQDKCWTYVVIFFGNLFSTIGNVASVMVRVHLVCDMWQHMGFLSRAEWTQTLGLTWHRTGLSAEKIKQRISPFLGKVPLRVQPCPHREDLHLNNSTSRHYNKQWLQSDEVE